MIKISIITPVFNGSQYLEQLILSVKNQKNFDNIEHIIINDGSTDNGATQSIINRFPHLVTRSRPNLGQYATINEGLRIASGDYIVVICADDLFFDSHIFENINHEISKNSGVDVIYGRTIRITESGDIVENDGVVIKEPFAKWRYKYQLPLLHCSTFVRRSFLIANNLYFDDANFKYAADWDWILRMSKLTNFKFIDLTISKYRVHVNQTTNITSRKVLKKEDMIVLKKNNSSIIFYYLIMNFERVRKAYFLFRKGGLSALYKKVNSFLT